MDDRFNTAWARATEYPTTILRPSRPHEYHERNARSEKLKEEAEALFDATEPKIEFWETGPENKFASHVFKTPDSTKAHLERTKNDPQIRHAFLEADDSRSPVNCHPDMFKSVCTYHQVEPSFLDVVRTFGDQDDPKDLCLMSFQSHDTLSTPTSKLVSIPKLNRSGREIHISFLLRAPEPKKNKDWRWQIRQAAVDHSFDTETGKAFWLTIKGNDEFNRRIKQGSPYLDLPAPDQTSQTGASIQSKPSDYFSATLATLLIYLHWCDENWRECINDMEKGILHILEMARKAPIDDDLDDKASLLETYPKSLRETRTRNSTMRSNKSAGNTARGSKANSKTNTGLSAGARPGTLRKRSTLEVIEGAGNALLTYLNMGNTPKQKVGDPEKDPGGPTATGGLFGGGHDTDDGDHSEEDEPPVDTRVVLNKFRFCDVQTLYTFSDRIRRSILTLTLNISVLEEMHAYYHDRLLTSDLETFRHIREGCKENGDSLAEFLREVKCLKKRLETRRTQLECLGVLLAEGNALYDGILQYRQLDISRLFQETSKKSADQMRIMANKTRVETASMHIITVVTMIFLPATFVATPLLFFFAYHKTFFQSGVFLWNDESPVQTSLMELDNQSYRYRGDGFKLFALVSAPMMVVTLGIWLAVFLHMRRRMRKGL